MRDTKNELLSGFHLQCGTIAFGYHVVTARGRRSGVTLLPSGLIGIPLACRIGSAIDGGESLRKSASLVNFGGVIFVPT